MEGNGYTQISEPFRSAEALADRLSIAEMVLVADATSEEHRGLQRGHLLHWNAENPDHPVEAFYDNGTVHYLIRVDLTANDEDAYADLVKAFCRKKQGGPDIGQPTNPARGGGMNANAASSRKPSVRIGKAIAEAYGHLCAHFHLGSQTEVEAENYLQVLKEKFGTNAYSYANRLRGATLVTERGGKFYLIAGDITIWGEGATGSSKPAAAKNGGTSASPPSPPATNGHATNQELLTALAEHAELVRSIGLLKQPERIGATISRLEVMLDELDPGLCVVDGTDGFSIRLKSAAPPKRRGRPLGSAKPRRRKKKS